MFFFFRKIKILISIYSDFYRVFIFIKEVYKDLFLWVWEVNKFVISVSGGWG